MDTVLDIFSLYVSFISFMRFVFCPAFSKEVIFFLSAAISVSFVSFSLLSCAVNFSFSRLSSVSSVVRSVIFVDVVDFIFSNSFFKRFTSASSFAFVCSTCFIRKKIIRISRNRLLIYSAVSNIGC